MEIQVPHDDAIRLLVHCDNPPEEPDAFSDAFHHWRQRAAINLATIFGDGSQAVKEFNAISFRGNVVSCSGVGLHKAHAAEEKQHHEEAYRRAVQRVRALVEGLRERVNIAQRQEEAEKEKQRRQRLNEVMAEARKDLRSRVRTASVRPQQEPAAPSQQAKPFSRRVFIVHGHDGRLKNAVARVVEAFGLEACVLHERPNKGRTVIEKFEGEAKPSGYAIVLFTGDDLAESQRALADAGDTVPKEKLKERARQNVVFELGYFVGHLGRGRVAVISDSGLEWPSDLVGVAYVSRKAWNAELVRELGECYEATQEQINRALAIVE